MKLVTYRFENTQRVGALTQDETAVLPLDYPDMNTLIETASPADLRAAASAAERAGVRVPLAEVELLAPIPRPRQDILCLGMNYKDHADEAAQYNAEAFTKEKPVAVYFSKRVSQAVAPEGDIERHAGLVERLDYEVELGVILGKAARNVKAEEAGDYIFGYTVINDVSARDEQTSHNGDPRQHSNTRLFLTGIPALLEELTAGMTLLPGTIIATGTPAGVGMGFDPPKFLQSGDVVECTIQGIGTIRNTVR